MRAIVDFLNRVRSFVRRDSLDRDIAEQMRVHVELQAEANERAGMSPAEALRAARLQFGSMERFRAECRDERRFGIAEDAVLDARYAARSLAAERSFSVAAVLALAVGIGAATAIYSLADHVLLRPVPGVRAPDELVLVEFRLDSLSSTGISRANVVDLERAVPALAGLAGHTTPVLQALPEDGRPLQLEGEAVVGDYFGVLGVQPVRGRFFSPEELSAAGGEANVAVLSHGTWQSLYGGAADVIGKSVRLNAHEFTIIGVAPPEFRGPQRLGATQVWLPAPAYESIRHFPEGHVSRRRSGSFQQLIGRLAPGASAALAESQLRSAMAGLVEQYPDDNAIYATYLPTVHEGIGTPPLRRHSTARTLTLLGAASALLLLIACANVANLIVFRSVRRRGELAVRRALGAGGGRLLRQSLVEGLMLSAAGSLAGGAVAFLLIRLLRTAEMRALPSLEGLTLDVRVFAFAVGIVVATGLLFGAIGAVATRGPALLPHIRRAGGATSRGLARTAFTVVQVAASIVLLSGALLLLRSVESLRNVDVGIDPAGVMVFGLTLDPQGYDVQRAHAFIEAVTGTLAADARITSVSSASGVPVISSAMHSGFRLPEQDRADEVMLQMVHVSEDYFRTLGMPIVAGRPLHRHEAFGAATGGEYAAVISEGAARLLFGDADPLGALIVPTRGMPTAPLRVVGVAADVQRTLREPPAPALFLPQSAQMFTFGGTYIVTKSARPTREVEALVAASVAALEPAVPFWVAGDLRERIDATLAVERLLSAMIGAFALLALLLSAIGLYGVIAYAVAQRRREIGIRAALGARPLQLVRLVSRQALLATALGAALGVAAALAGSRLLETWLFGVERMDPGVYLAATGMLLLIAVLAAAVPARAATRLDPVQSLRVE
jgi:predicted permease